MIKILCVIIMTTTIMSAYVAHVQEHVISPYQGECEMVSLGYFRIVHYCRCVRCTNSGNGITATGVEAVEGVTVAADWNVLPPGTRIYLNGNIYTVQDRGGGVRGRMIDRYVGNSDHARALRYGVFYAEVFKLVENE